MDFFDWLTVLFSFAIALYLMFGGGADRDWPPLMPPHGDDEGHTG